MNPHMWAHNERPLHRGAGAVRSGLTRALTAPSARRLNTGDRTSPRRILVTGGAGFIGQAVRRILDVRGDEFVSFDHPNDIRSYGDVYGALTDDRVDGVIHLAGILGTAETLNNERELIDVNILGALNIAHMCEQRGVPMVQIGTGHRGQPNVYAITKACAEDLILARVEWGKLQANVVRAYHAYGPGQKAPAPYGKATVRKIIPAFVCAALRGDPLVINGTGRQVIDLVHVDDVARVLVDGLEGPYGRVLAAGTGHGVTVLDAARAVIRACESTSQIEHVPMRPGEPAMSTVVASWAEARCDIEWPHLDETIAYYREMLS